MNIPQKFYNPSPNETEAWNIEELKALLNELPEHLPVACSLNGGVKLIIANVGMIDEHLAFVDTDEEVE